MSPTTAEAALAKIVSQVPGSARVLSAFGLDYSCSGQRRLADACRNVKVDLDSVLAALEGIEAQPGDDRLLGWETASVESLITHIVDQYHVPLVEKFERIEVITSELYATYGTSGHVYPKLDGVLEVLQELLPDITRHMRQEEEDLFPDLLQGHGYSATMFVRVMGLQHRDNIRMLEALQGMTDGYRVRESHTLVMRTLFAELAELDTSLREHIHLENNVLFPIALRA